MGLDMYLNKRRYIGLNYKSVRAQFKAKGKKLPNLSVFGVNIEEVTSISCQCLYWRKANAIHGWFVREVQNGNDDCGTYEVSREKLKELRAACVEVLADHSKAEELLPPQEGFFFGGTEPDKYYFSDLKETIEGIDKVLALDDGWDFFYQSSW